MANKRISDKLEDLVAAYGTFKMYDGEDTDDAPFTSKMQHMLKGVNYIRIDSDTIFDALEEGTAIDVLDEGDDDYPGQRLGGNTIPAGSFLWATQSFTRISVTSGEITCARGSKPR